MPDLRLLTIKRGQVKAKLTRCKHFFENPSNQDNIEELEVRFQTLGSILSDFENIQDEIEVIDQETNQELEREDFESQYYDLFARLKKHIREKSNLTETSKNVSNYLPSTSSNSISIKLPIINLPTFSGKYDEWMSFYDTFCALIDKNDSLSEVQKLHYLKASLIGDAAKTLDNLDLIASNYAIAISLLKEQFHNVKLIVQNHVKTLFNLPQVEKNSFTSLKNLVNTVSTHMRALKSLNQPTEAWDTLIIHLITTKLDPWTHREWELSTKPSELPTFEELKEFLQKRSQILENLTHHRTPNTPQHDKANLHFKQNTQYKYKPKVNVVVQGQTCTICSGKHAIFQCYELQQSSHDDQIKKLLKAKVCFNCLTPGHNVSQCKSSGCKKCGKKHNTILHQVNSQTYNVSPQPTVENTTSLTAVETCTNTTTHGNSEVLLSTALVRVVSPDGTALTCRAFLDNGSQSNFITEAVCQQLLLKKQRSALVVTGISEGSTRVHSKVQSTVKSLTSSYSTEAEFLVVPKITGLIPTTQINTTAWPMPHNITLADPSFAKPGKIDLLLGQEYFFDLLENGRISNKNMPTLQNTKLGWIIGGRAVTNSNKKNTVATTCHLSVMERLDRQLQEFWKIEEINSKTPMSKEDDACERFYVSSVRRNNDGRYTVNMPFKEEPMKLGTSRHIAETRYIQVERRLQRQPNIQRQYIDFMREYEQLGHMEQVTSQDTSTQEYFLPHHPVFKDSSSTTKLRVVFDASTKTSTGQSLNDIMMVGPTIQDDLFSILLRFRTHIYVLTADIEKMYRQIWVEPNQRSLLRILWRENPTDNLQTYQLKTVTYGTACAPYLAIKTLQQLAEDEKEKFPAAATVVMNDFYVDDLLTGTDSIEEGKLLQGEITALLKRGGFNLRKWNTNHDELLKQLPADMRERHPQQFPSDCNSVTKTLGLLWNATDDTLKFTYHINIDTSQNSAQEVTKRSVLSTVAKLFDPLGLVSPVVIRAKILLQELWKTKLDWDETLPKDLHEKWLVFKHCLCTLSKAEIPRSTVLSQPGGVLEIHGFSDASEIAYGGAVYVKYKAVDTSCVRLLCSKSRVAPLKTVSLPRLELCGALLLAELMCQVKKALGGKIHNTFYWTDSSIVISWIASDASRWKTFVANRVSKIQDLTEIEDWRHVNSENNPADLVSRGAKTRDLLNSRLWWNGPTWLTEELSSWPLTLSKTVQDKIILEEKRKKETTASAVTDKNKSYLLSKIEKCSSLQRLQRIIAYCFRYIHNCQHPNNKSTGPLTTEELSLSMKRLIKADQGHFFVSEIADLSSGRQLHTKSKLLVLQPFIDADGLLRVGGRLDHSDLKFDHKHPIVLSKESHLTNLIARNEHIRHLHAGPQALLAAMRQEFWPLGGRNLARRTVHQCVTCFKARPKWNQPEMGKLPTNRTTPSRPFTNTGVDYCGPIYIKSGSNRNSRLIKSFIAIFVCFATKAVHLELVSDLTTEAFLAAFKRFVSRRGLCVNIYSDNGTNFVGANNELKELYRLLRDHEHQRKIVDSTSTQKIKWHFIPPKSPHFGGLWEAGVKSIKYHLKRVVGKANLTYEAMYTTLTTIEACLNSRPLTPLSTDPNEPTPLTPGHFITGDALTSLPEQDVAAVPTNRLSRWQRTQQLMQHFWSRWSTEYLSQLQQRQKWSTGSIDIQPGQVVMVREDNLPPMKWITAVVKEVHPGADGRVRVATVQSASGLFKRAANRLCVLPIDNA